LPVSLIHIIHAKFIFCPVDGIQTSYTLWLCSRAAFAHDTIILPAQHCGMYFNKLYTPPLKLYTIKSSIRKNFQDDGISHHISSVGNHHGALVFEVSKIIIPYFNVKIDL